MGNMWHVKNWFRVGRNISWALDFHTLFGFLYLIKPTRFFYKQALKKHEFVLNYLKTNMSDVIEEFKNYKEIEETTPSEEARRIWTIWWQGEENAPPLVKACINSMKENANGAKVTVITTENCKDYVDIPDYILEKHKKGYICNAVLSDITRFMLLEKYGGLWLDATIYVAKPIPSEYFKYRLYSQHTKPETMTCWVQNNAYHIFVVGSQPKGKMVSFTLKMFLEYWRRYDVAVDYLSTDYFFMIAMQEYPEIKEEIDSLPYSSERLYDLVHILNKPYDDLYFNKLKEECIFSKLDWHKKYKLMKKKSIPTYYNEIVNFTNA